MPEKVGEMRFEIYRLWIMVKLAWRIVQARKNAAGCSRISEAGEYALYVVDMNKKVAPKKFVGPHLRSVVHLPLIFYDRQYGEEGRISLHFLFTRTMRIL